MKAARLNAPGEPLVIEEIPVPAVHPDGVVVRVLSSHMMSYTDEVFSGGEGRLPTPTPYTPGLSAVGFVEEVGDDVVGLAEGDFVFCNPHVVDAAPDRDPEMILIGWFGLTPGAGPLLDKWKNGSFAEFAGYPATCVTRIDPSLKDRHAALAHLNILTVAYGALQKGGWQPGCSLVVNGVTGNIGASTALLALALGARKVVGLGRDREVLAQVAQIDPRIECVALSGDTGTDLEALLQMEPRADLCVDASAAPDSSSTEVALGGLKYGGCAVWVGGVGTSIPVPYASVLIRELKIVGSYMYDTDCPLQLVRMIESGVLDLSLIDTHAYPLEKINDAISQAPHCKGLSSVVIQP